MKQITKQIPPFQEKDFFLPVRDKIDYTKLILYSTRLLLIDYTMPSSILQCSMQLIVDKMSRLFFNKENKFFSVSYPFNIFIDGGIIKDISTYSGTIVDNEILSYAISIINNENFQLNPSPIAFWEECDEYEMKGLNLLEEIFLFEPSYIRYDKDETNQNGKLHPLHHLDINYSAYGTYKLGLKKDMVELSFQNILNITTDCKFLYD